MVDTHFACAPRTTTRFEIHADRCPQALARIIDMLAREALLPRNLHLRQSCAGLWMALDLDIAAGSATRLADRLRGLPSIFAVLLLPPPQRAEPAMSAPLHAPSQRPEPALRALHLT